VTCLVLSVTLIFAWLTFGDFGLAWAVIPLVCHVLFYVCSRDKVWQVEVSKDGDVLWNGKPWAVIQRNKDIVLFVLMALYCTGGYYLYRYTFHK